MYLKVYFKLDTGRNPTALPLMMTGQQENNDNLGRIKAWRNYSSRNGIYKKIKGGNRIPKRPTRARFSAGSFYEF